MMVFLCRSGRGPDHNPALQSFFDSATTALPAVSVDCVMMRRFRSAREGKETHIRMNHA